MLHLAIGFDLALQLDEFLGACIHATENPTMIKGYRARQANDSSRTIPPPIALSRFARRPTDIVDFGL